MASKERPIMATQPSPDPWSYATKPTAGTIFLRTFLPWQLWRFVVINLRMMSMIRTSHQGRRR